MFPEVNNIFKILQKTSTKRNNQPTPHDPKVEYNNIFLKLITVSKVGTNIQNNINRKTRNKKNILNRFDISSTESFTKSHNYEKQILPNVHYVSNRNRFPLSLSVNKCSDPIYFGNYLFFLNNIRLKENHDFKKKILNLENNCLNNSGSNSLERNQNKYHNDEKFKYHKREFDSMNIYKTDNLQNHELPELTQYNKINDIHIQNNNEKNTENENNKENNEINNEKKENNKERLNNYNLGKSRKINYLNLLNKVKQKSNNIEENKNIVPNILNNPNRKLIDICKKNISFQKDFKRIKFNTQEKQLPLKLLDSLKNNFATKEEIGRKLNYKMIPFPLNQNINNQTNQFYFYINKKYRNQLVDYFEHRLNWEFVNHLNDPNYPIINFYWKYYSTKFNYKQFIYDPSLPMKRLKVINLFQRNYEVGNKKNLFINLVQYCDKMNINVFDIVPFTIVIPISRINDCFDAFFEVFHLIHSNTNNYCNNDKDLITNKNYNELFGFDINFSMLQNTPIFINKYFLSEKNYWILKPADLYQGMCIEILNNYEDIVKQGKKMFKGVDKNPLTENIEEENEIENEENKNNININNLIISKKFNNNKHDNESEDEIDEEKKKKKGNSMYISNSIILQKYLDNPLLYNKRKFDIRCYVLIDSNLNVYFCREGHLKGSSEKYDLNNPNKFIHITNYSFQKKSNKFEKYEFGNEISYKDFKLYLEKEKISLDNFDNLINDMKYLIKISMNSVGKKLFKTENVLCFEIFGYDFIVDNNFKPWILEINDNPGLAISSPVIEKLVPRMLDDALRLTIDKIFDTKYDDSCCDKENNLYISKYKLDGYSDHENVFEFLCNVSY